MVGKKVAAGAMPMPVRLIADGDPAALCVRFKEPERVPVVEGRNCIKKVQVRPGVTVIGVEPQVPPVCV